MIPATDISFRRSQETAGSSDRRAGWGWLLLCILLAGGFLFKALSAASSAPDRSDVAGASATARLADSEPYQTVNIEELAEGDTVLAQDPRTGEVQQKRVVRVYRRLSDHLRVLNIRGRDGTSRELKTTDDHPFWVVQDNDFKPAAELRPGDDFIGPDGEMQTLASTCREDYSDGVAVYNVETEDYHTYFVAAHGTRAPPSLVHNCDVTRGADQTRVFWSGDGAREAAERWAKENNAATLGMTDAGRGLEQTTKGMNYLTEGRAQWIAGSREFADGASGQVHVFHSATGVDVQSIWTIAEYPALVRNRKVSEIISHIVMPDGTFITLP
jgi:hypothetical protein